MLGGHDEHDHDPDRVTPSPTGPAGGAPAGLPAHTHEGRLLPMPAVPNRTSHGAVEPPAGRRPTTPAVQRSAQEVLAVVKQAESGDRWSW
jgi:hypothetical protein